MKKEKRKIENKKRKRKEIKEKRQKINAIINAILKDIRERISEMSLSEISKLANHTTLYFREKYRVFEKSIMEELIIKHQNDNFVCPFYLWEYKGKKEKIINTMGNKIEKIREILNRTPDKEKVLKIEEIEEIDLSSISMSELIKISSEADEILKSFSHQNFLKGSRSIENILKDSIEEYPQYKEELEKAEKILNSLEESEKKKFFFDLKRKEYKNIIRLSKEDYYGDRVSMEDLRGYVKTICKNTIIFKDGSTITCNDDDFMAEFKTPARISAFLCDVNRKDPNSYVLIMLQVLVEEMSKKKPVLVLKNN